MDHTDPYKEAEHESLTQAAMVLCVMVSAHEIQCTCDGCRLAAQAAEYLPKMRQSYRQQFEKKLAFHKRINRNLT